VVHRIRVPMARQAGSAFTREQLQLIADAINKKAKDRRLLGQIEYPGDGKTRLNRCTHYVLPDAQVRGGSILISIETVDTAPGRTLKAMIEGKVPMRGSIRGFMLGMTPGNSVSGVDIDLSPDPEITVLDDIVDALETDED
jgi:hypothetical protein